MLGTGWRRGCFDRWGQRAAPSSPHLARASTASPGPALGLPNRATQRPCTST